MISDAIAYWPINEISGNSVADVNGGNNGTATGTTIVDGKINNGRSFIAANSDFINVGAGSSLQLESSEMTVSSWVKLNSIGGYQYIASDYNVTANNSKGSLLLLNTGDGGQFTFFWANAGTQSPTPQTAKGTTVATTGVWYHVVGVRSGSAGAWTSKIYVNGTVENSTATADNPAAGGNWSIGRPGDFVSSYTDGIIDEVRIYNRALSAAEINQVYLFGGAKLNASRTRPRPFAPGLAR